PTNPVALLELKDDRSDEKRYITNFSADYRIPFLPELRANLNLAYDFHFGEGEVNIPTYAAFAFDPVNGGGVHNIYSQTKKNSLLEFYLNYKKGFQRHTIDLMGGYSWQHFEVDSKYKNSDVAGTPLKTIQDSLNPAEFYLVSFFGRANYTYNEKLLLTFTLRRDGTSRFSPENRWGFFPAAALAFKVFDADRTQFNNLKLRLGWGITGQQEIGDYYAYLARYKFSNAFAQYQFGDEFITTYRPNGYDANIKWEETKTYNAGVDFSIIRDRLSGSLDLYKRYTTDLLNEIPVPAGTNLTNFIVTNVGNMENKGLEFSLFATPVMNQNVTWDISANVAFNQNEITKLRAIDDPDYAGILVGGISGGVGSTIQIHTVGYAPYSYFVYEQAYDENGQIIEGVFVDRNADGVVNDEDKYRFAKPSADMTLGFTNRLQIKNFDFGFAGRASIGNYMYNNVQTDRGYLDRLFLETGGKSLWNVHQSAVDLDVHTQGNLTLSDYFVQKADFLKIDHVTVGYNFNDLIGKFLRLSVTMQNVLTISKYEGLDPEIFSGIDNSIYPRPRTFVFGLNVEF
ncbi:MAG: TonB-dependent receptor, partial [Saprospiraceae bacterium]